jgi:NAD(P)H-hydrate epimerase
MLGLMIVAAAFVAQIVVDRLGIEIHDTDRVDRLGSFDVAIDGIIGYSLTGAPRGSAATLIGWANQTARPVLSLDVPSGLDATTGDAHDPVVRAAATLTLALPKVGLRHGGALPLVGELYVGDIGVPAEVYSAPSVGLDVGADIGATFATAEIVRIW